MKVIVTTTIYDPSKELLEFSSLSDWKIIVVGDVITPHEKYENLDNVIYLSPEYQEKKHKTLSDLIGWKNIQRRNIGFIEAYRLGADIIASVDDDNMPYSGWGQNLLLGTQVAAKQHITELVCFDPIFVTNYSHLWHRGFPIDLIKRRQCETQSGSIKADIQSDFWNGDPDIDAICRMIHNVDCDFDDACFPFFSHSFSPFNSQNTFFTKDVIKHYFVFPHIGRMDDIWASYYVEAMGYKVVYNKATVYQERNKQDIMKNFENEILGYTKTNKLLESLRNDPESLKNFIPERSWLSFLEYKKSF